MGGKKGAARSNTNKSRRPWSNARRVSSEQAAEMLAMQLQIPVQLQQTVAPHIKAITKSAKQYDLFEKWSKKFEQTAKALAAIQLPPLSGNGRLPSMQTAGREEYVDDVYQLAKQQLALLRATVDRLRAPGIQPRGAPRTFDLAMFALQLPTILRREGFSGECTPTMLALFAIAVRLGGRPSMKSGFENVVKRWQEIHSRAAKLADQHKEGIRQASTEAIPSAIIASIVG